MATLREIQLCDLEKLIAHLERHFRELGIGGVIAQPYSATEPFKSEEYRQRAMKRWARTPGDGPWEKMWVIEDNEQIVGHIDLNGTARAVISHRAKLGMGIETAYRSQGWGKRLLQTALNWAKENSTLSWIDLDVFAHNTAAINLYKQFGFTTIGMTPDRLRVSNQIIDDLQMTLAIEKIPVGDTKTEKPQLRNIRDLPHQEMNTKSERLSLSAVLTDTSNFQKLFVHHEIIPSQRRSSTPHFHTHTEEMFIVLEGHPTFHYGSHKWKAKPGDFMTFNPGDPKHHFISNESHEEVRVLGICADEPLDKTHY